MVNYSPPGVLSGEGMALNASGCKAQVLVPLFSSGFFDKLETSMHDLQIVLYLFTNHYSHSLR